ncbi:DUF6516 family protein [candidate division KSB1 bacterium]|nr:DUF6516 family protein [candidate division KSB1 bacterium]
MSITDPSLASLADYSRKISELVDSSIVERSTVAVWSNSPYTGIAEGEIYFLQGFRLRMHEEIDFAAALITSYGYEVYHDEERLFWYDDFPHPKDLTLAVTFPHHKHVPPDIKRHRVPAYGISYYECNLSLLINEIQMLIQQLK